jgi:hypothetical protein
MDNEILQFILSRLEKLDERTADEHVRIMAELSKQSANLETYNRSLEEHMRRTELLEEGQKDLEARVEPMESYFLRKRIIRDFFKSGVAKVTGTITVLAAAAGGVYHLLHIILKIF